MGYILYQYMCSWLHTCRMRYMLYQYMCSWLLTCRMRYILYQYMCSWLLTCRMRYMLYQYMCSWLLTCRIWNTCCINICAHDSLHAGYGDTCCINICPHNCLHAGYEIHAVSIYVLITAYMQDMIYMLYQYMCSWLLTCRIWDTCCINICAHDCFHHPACIMLYEYGLKATIYMINLPSSVVLGTLSWQMIQRCAVMTRTYCWYLVLLTLFLHKAVTGQFLISTQFYV